MNTTAMRGRCAGGKKPRIQKVQIQSSNCSNLLDLPELGSIFFIAVHAVLCFGFLIEIVLRTLHVLSAAEEYLHTMKGFF